MKFAARIVILRLGGTKGLLNIMPSPAVSYTHGSLLTLIFFGDFNRDSRDRSVRLATTECSGPCFVHLIRARQNQTLTAHQRQDDREVEKIDGNTGRKGRSVLTEMIIQDPREPAAGRHPAATA